MDSNKIASIRARIDQNRGLAQDLVFNYLQNHPIGGPNFLFDVLRAQSEKIREQFKQMSQKEMVTIGEIIDVAVSLEGVSMMIDQLLTEQGAQIEF